jgi:hypothetical protein
VLICLVKQRVIRLQYKNKINLNTNREGRGTNVHYGCNAIMQQCKMEPVQIKRDFICCPTHALRAVIIFIYAHCSVTNSANIDTLDLYVLQLID